SVNALIAVSLVAVRDPGDVLVIDLNKNTLFLNMQIRVAEEKEYKTYSLAITDSRGERVWQEDPLEKNALGNFNLLIPTNFLTPGEYVLKIYGRRGDRRTLLSQSRFRIQRQG